MKVKIDRKKALIGVMGLGYVGLPLAVEFAKSHYHVTGIDPDQKKCREINSGKSYITDISNEDLQSVVKKGFLHATHDFSVLSEMDVVFICVPTPFSKFKEPDVSFIIEHHLSRHHRGNRAAHSPKRRPPVRR